MSVDAPPVCPGGRSGREGPGRQRQWVVNLPLMTASESSAEDACLHLRREGLEA